MKILTLSDIVLDSVYNPAVRQRYGAVDLILGCGDMPYYYLEYVLNALNCPAYYVRGNHARIVEYSDAGERTEPHGAVNLHQRVINHKGLLLAGIEGCLRYRPAPFQYTQGEYWSMVLGLAPSLLWNRIFLGRALDVFVTHTPAWGLGDRDDAPHRGVKAFRWLLHVFKPLLHVHGHVHLYRNDDAFRTTFEKTRIVNTYGVRLHELEPPDKGRNRWSLIN